MRFGVTVLALCLGMTVVAGAAPRREGRITIARGDNNGRTGSSADAVFFEGPAWGLEIASDGPCTLRKPIPASGLSAGTITITGTVSPITLGEKPTASGVRYAREGALPRPAFVDGAAITVEAAGGSDIPAFSAQVTAPPTLAGYSQPRVLSRDGYAARWAGATGSEILIAILAFDHARHELVVVCRVPDTGSFNVPRSTFAMLPPAFDSGIVIFGRVAETVQVVGDTRIMVDVVSSAGPSTPLRIEPPVMQSDRLRPTSRFFVALAFDFGVPKMFKLQFARRLGRDLHLVAEMTETGSEYTLGLPDTRESYSSLGVGVRWTPIGISRNFFVFAPYATAIVGAEARDRITETGPGVFTDDTAWSPMASLATGVMEFSGRDWQVGPELRVQVARFDGNLQHDWQMMLAIHLNAW
jgi:hypothetical protein